MKKRIISLILVVAMAFLALTGCSFNYAKKDLSKYATFNPDAFYSALQDLKIDDGTFGHNEDERVAKVKDAIAQAILKVTDATDKKFSGKLSAYDSIYFCYYATDGMNKLYTSDKMDASKPTSIQLGLSTLSSFNKLIADNLLAVDDIAHHLYTTSTVATLGVGDIFSVSYTKTWTDAEGEHTKDVYNEYTAFDGNNEFHNKLVGAPVGIDSGDAQFTVNEKIAEETLSVTYKNVKIETILKDNEGDKIEEGDKILVTYTVSFDAKDFYNDETQEYENLPDIYKNKLDAHGKYTQTYTYELRDVKNLENDFTSKLIGKATSAAASDIGTIEIKEEIGGKEVTLKYSGVQIKAIAEYIGNPIEIKYNPYTDEALKEDKSNQQKAKNEKGEEVLLEDRELTYYIFPVYYLDVDYDGEVNGENADTILREFYATVGTKEVPEHDHSEEGHEHVEEYIFATLKDNGENFKNGNDTLAALVTELGTLGKTLTEKETALSKALDALVKAQNSLATYTGDSEGELASRVSAKDTAHTAFIDARNAKVEAEDKFNEKLELALGCKNGDDVVTDNLDKDYYDYQYDVLEDAYKAEVSKNLAKVIVTYLKDNVKFEGELPKAAVKEAYDSIMNTYKQEFYEGDYDSKTSETNYKHYNGDFDQYLIDNVAKGKDMDAVKAALDLKAQEAVKEIIRIYVFAKAVEEKWDADVLLTKQEKKDIKKNLENTALLYSQYGITFNYNVRDYYHSEQFDKALNYLLEEKHTDTPKVEYEHIKYDFNEPAEK